LIWNLLFTFIHINGIKLTLHLSFDGLVLEDKFFKSHVTRYFVTLSYILSTILHLHSPTTFLYDIYVCSFLHLHYPTTFLYEIIVCSFLMYYQGQLRHIKEKYIT
jgi:hypothetical protein